ncbi:hypothetical protein LFE_1296 [Leptospirillum ferrooxidans C2-3]|uniref:Uncharacterized protein n=1 Tax=Leptospirillum ferrooxidans (strain C2-3) TaxID=1162668 RepID=I0INY0_LEPFC|nr:hypothetical protein LFE_1296 [Leptospirillum ferrooxidans C2-3]
MVATHGDTNGGFKDKKSHSPSLARRVSFYGVIDQPEMCCSPENGALAGKAGERVVWLRSQGLEWAKSTPTPNIHS